ncbi:tail fiber domain-containing protein [Pseudomonas sp. ZM23]|uniref:Tail fiber domain-containing protein n=1 Tax=Pseudomonas triclosanedens TaxID=2961893 RepID=A0ABY6ZRN4_9PSED|nr:tail fiber domain-containing protein [Pseudomonas triclosanedens]MCP8465943.1 tail fiber domain-containing protein [Pseudomonas triclosanedens]MCP8472264.1 tail fiber domain-containing protein [Pseudomonas triclosanedens]MCP8477242.1 tail fiber domain-containing protein [Pseudomonas triclosanedens]WAI47420.1 tail fiber domain-containing protein [Pseudomonas triclosanedens]
MANSYIPARFQYTGSAVTALAEYQPGDPFVLPGSGGTGGRILANSGAFTLEAFGSAYPMTFVVNGVERMRLESNGDQTFGTSNANPILNRAAGYRYFNAAGWNQYSPNGSNLGLGSGTTGPVVLFWHNPGTASQVGSISITTTTTAYNTSSDYRLKDEVRPLDPVAATARIMAYEPCTWTWKIDGSPGKGFIAHRNQMVDPSTATGKKDEVCRIGNIRMPDYTLLAEGIEEPTDMTNYPAGAAWVFTEEQPVYQGRDDTKIIPDLVAMIQRMELRIRELEARA